MIQFHNEKQFEYALLEPVSDNGKEEPFIFWRMFGEYKDIPHEVVPQYRLDKSSIVDVAITFFKPDNAPLLRILIELKNNSLSISDVEQAMRYYFGDYWTAAGDHRTVSFLIGPGTDNNVDDVYPNVIEALSGKLAVIYTEYSLKSGLDFVWAENGTEMKVFGFLDGYLSLLRQELNTENPE